MALVVETATLPKDALYRDRRPHTAQSLNVVAGPSKGAFAQPKHPSTPQHQRAAMSFSAGHYGQPNGLPAGGQHAYANANGQAQQQQHPYGGDGSPSIYTVRASLMFPFNHCPP